MDRSWWGYHAAQGVVVRRMGRCRNHRHVRERGLGPPTEVRNANSDLRVIFGESAQSEDYNDRIFARRYGYGDGGFTQWPVETDPWYKYVVEQVVYKDGVSADMLDTSIVRQNVTLVGSPSISGNRLTLNGSSQYARISRVDNSQRRYYMSGVANKNSGEFCFDIRAIKFGSTSGTMGLWSRDSTGSDKTFSLFYRDTVPGLSAEFRFSGGSTDVVQASFTPDLTKEYDIRISRDSTGQCRIHVAESGSDLVMLTSQSIGTSELNPITEDVNHGAYNNGSALFTGSLAGTRVTAHDRGTTDADVPADDMAFDT